MAEKNDRRAQCNPAGRIAPRPTTKQIEDSIEVSALVGNVNALPDPKTLGKPQMGMGL